MDRVAPAEAEALAARVQELESQVRGNEAMMYVDRVMYRQFLCEALICHLLLPQVLDYEQQYDAVCRELESAREFYQVGSGYRF